MSAVGKVYLTIDKILVQIISVALGVFKWNVTVVLYKCHFIISYLKIVICILKSEEVRNLLISCKVLLTEK